MAAASALRHASVTISSEPVLESKAHPEAVVEIALFVPAGFPAEAPGGAGPVQAGEGDALRLRDLDDAGRDRLRLLAEADDEADAAAFAVFAGGAQQVAVVRVGDVRGLRGVQRVADAEAGQVFLDRAGERIDLRRGVVGVAQAEGDAEILRQRAARLGAEAPLGQDLRVGRDVGGEAVAPMGAGAVREAGQQRLVAGAEALLEVRAGEQAARAAEPAVEAERGALPGVAAAGQVLVADVGRDARAALEQAALVERRLALGGPGGLR